MFDSVPTRAEFGMCTPFVSLKLSDFRRFQDWLNVSWVRLQDKTNLSFLVTFAQVLRPVQLLGVG